jgi:PHD/YefM family antitoxin component YafN of YafNO toxin-antitoxin module
MKFVTARELRVDPGKVWKVLKEESDVVVTSRGKPIAIMNAVEEGDLETTMQDLRRVRAIRALKEIQELAKKSGLSKMTMADINREIQAARKQRKCRK